MSTTTDGFPHPGAMALRAEATIHLVSQLGEPLLTVCQAAMTDDRQALAHAVSDLVHYVMLMQKGARHDLDLARAYLGLPDHWSLTTEDNGTLTALDQDKIVCRFELPDLVRQEVAEEPKRPTLRLVGGTAA